jgi:iron-sulfur cluster repair protein YtfE (RIC family)
MLKSPYDFFALVDLLCWGVCFWWMHRISSRQNATLKQLQEQARRIEEVSKAEHEILTDLHPSVQKIEQDLGAVSQKIEPEDSPP